MREAGSKRLTLLWVLTLLACLAAGCVPGTTENAPSTGTITLVNNSDHEILWVNGSPIIGLDATLEGRTSWQSLPPGRSISRGSDASPDDSGWCETSNRTHWLLRPRAGLRLDGSPRSVTAEDFEVLASRGPAYCWGERDSEWVFTGS